MFKKENETWLYLIGIVLMFAVIAIAGKQIFIPVLSGKASLNSIASGNTQNKPQFTKNKKKNYLAKIETNYGAMTAILYAPSAPQNVNNFINLAKSSYYNGTKFHRLIPNFLIQGGDKNTLQSNVGDWGLGNPGYLIEDEVNWDSLNLSNDQKTKLNNAGYASTPGIVSHPLERYSLAMANSGPNTNGSQFFIIIAPSDDSRLRDLQGYFTVIGKVINGTDVLDQLNRIPVDDPTNNVPHPTKDIVLQKIEITN